MARPGKPRFDWRSRQTQDGAYPEGWLLPEERRPQGGKDVNRQDHTGQDGVETSRRKFLKTAGKLAVYVPPAMLAISQPSYATFAQSAGVTHRGPTFRSLSVARRSHAYRWRRWLGVR